MAHYFYLDANILGVVPGSKILHTQHTNDSDGYVVGDIVEAWDHVFRWDADCVPNATMAEWRFQGDDLADTALPVIMEDNRDSGGHDLLARLETAASAIKPDQHVTELWNSLTNIDQTAFSYDRDQIARGQAVFWRYAPQILASLLQFSLAAGFSSPSISRVLNLTSYLVPPMESTPQGEAPRITKASNDRTYQRLMETTQFVLDCMSEDAMEVQGRGWRAAVRVRLLHATMRRRLLEKIRSAFVNMPDPPYVEARDGLPISQEDYVATLTSFSGFPLLNLMKVGVRPTVQEREDYTALWKVIGYHLGINQEILNAHMTSWHQSTRLCASSIMNVLAAESNPPPATQFPFQKTLVPKQDRVIHVDQKGHNGDAWTTPATLAVLFSVCNRWPSPFDLSDHCAASRRLMGPTLSDWLSVPRTTYLDSVKLYLGFAMVNFPSEFGKRYRSGWDLRRRKAMEVTVTTAIYTVLGDRTTKFKPRDQGAFQPKRDPDEYGAFATGRVATAALDWTLLYGEMVVVLLVLAPLMPLYAVWALSRIMVGHGDVPLFATSRVLVTAH